MSIKQRVDRLEKQPGAIVGAKYFLHIVLKDGETIDEGLDRECHAKGIERSDVGHVVIFGDDVFEDIDYENHDGLETLRGYAEFMEMMERVFKDIDGKTTGPTGVEAQS